MSEQIEIKIKCSNETKLSIKVSMSDTILNLKEKIAEELKSTNIPTEPSEQRLIYAGRILKDNETILDIKIKDGNTIHFVRSKPKTPAATSNAKETEQPKTTTTTTSNTTSNTPVSATQSTETPATTQPRAPQSSPMSGTDNPFSNLLGNNGAANPFAQLGMNAGFNSAMMGQMGQMGQMPPYDPEMMNAMLNNPAMLNMMTSMMSNPQFSEMLFQSNPQLAQLNTPEFRNIVTQMMSNPDTIRSILQMYNTFSGNRSTGGATTAPPPFNPFQNFMGQTTTQPNTNTTPAQTNPVPPLGQPDFSSLMGLLGNMNMPANTPSNVPQQPPEERFSSQLAQLQDMGFYDSTQNIRALTITGGRVEAAVEWLLNNPSY